MSHESHPGWVRTTAVGLMATSALAACTPEHHESPSPGVHFHTGYPGTEASVPTYVPPSCAAPGPADVNAASALLARPENRIFTLTYASSSKNNFLTDRAKLDSAEAKANGLTIFHEPTSTANLEENLYQGHKTLPFETYLRNSQAYMSQLGVDVRLGAPHDPNYIDGSRPPTAAELATKAAKDTALTIEESFVDVPKQYVALSGLKHIIIVAGTNQNSAEAYAITEGPHDTMYIDIADDTGVEMHEMYHLLDAAMCGTDGMQSDPSFTALDKGVNIYSNNADDTKHISYEDRFVPDDQKWLTAEANAEITNNKAAYCRAEAAENAEAHKVISFSNYHTNVMEDKAETGKNIADPFMYNVMTDPQFPTLVAKFKYLFARLYEHAPAIARYFAATSNRPDGPDPQTPKC